MNNTNLTSQGLNSNNSLFQKIETSYWNAMRQFFFLFSFSFRFWKIGIISSILLTLYGIFRALTIFSLGPVIKIIISQKGLTNHHQVNSNSLFDIDYLTNFFLNLVQSLVTDKYSILIAVCVVVIIFVIIAGCCQYFGKYLSWKFNMLTFYHIQRIIYEHISSLSLRFFYQHKTGELMSHVHNDISVSLGLFQKIMLSMTSYPVLLISLMWVLIKTNSKLTFISLSTSIVSSIIIAIFGRHLSYLQSKVMSQLAAVTSVIQESFANIKLIKVFNLEKYESKKYYQRAVEHLNSNGNIMRRQIFAPTLVEFMAFITLVVILLLGAKDVFCGKMSVESLIMFLVVAINLIQPVKGLGDTIISFFSVLGASDRIINILKETDTVQDGNKTIEFFKNNLCIKNVSFAYDQISVLEKLSFTIIKGQTVAIVGPSGSGKSTLIDIILRLYDPEKGDLFLDDINIKEFTCESYRQLFGVVTQETYLFNDTIKQNISYGTQKTDDQIISAAKIANAHDFIMQLPDNYDTIVGDRGVKLSGGQRQRLAIARAIIRNPSILIFDEATSSLDNESEKIVQHSIDTVLRDTTAIIIAHRLSTIRNADIILVLDKGQIIESDHHEKLIEQNGLYKKLYDLQSELNLTL